MSEERNEAIPNRKRIASFLYSDMMVLIYVHPPLLKKLNKSRVPDDKSGTLIYIGNRASGIGHRESGIGNRESGIGHRASGIGHRASGIGNCELRIGN
ncbi:MULTISPECIES: hypothetical protein [unclassified Microcoleus]|uniref:hypothetical protein n=1 Tax=unclassified Microcoleus TaxID=2642155 RepID=UPI002FD2DA68